MRSSFRARLLAGLAACFMTLGAHAANPHVVIVGGTSKTAGALMPQALAAGFDVTAIARRPDAITLKDARLQVLRGDVYEPDSLRAALRGGDETVYFLVSPRVDPMAKLEAMDLFSTGVTNVIEAMRAKGSKRLVVASSIAVETEIPAERPAPGNPRAMWLWNVRELYQDMARMEAIVAKSGLQYVITRPAFIVDEPARNDLVLAVNSNSPPGRMLTTSDLAAFMLEQARSDKYLGATVGVYTERELRFGQNADYDKMAEKSKAAREAAEKLKQQQP